MKPLQIKGFLFYWLHKPELEYSLAERRIETNGILDVAARNNINVLAFGVLTHDLLSGRALGGIPGGSGAGRWYERSCLPGWTNETSAVINSIPENKNLYL